MKEHMETYVLTKVSVGGDEYESQLGNSLYRTMEVSSPQAHR